MAVHSIALAGVDVVAVKDKQVLQLFGHEAEAGAGLARGGDESLPQLRRQAIVEGPAAIGVDVDAVALQPVGANPVPLIDGHSDPGAPQALGQAEAANSAADDE